MSAPDEPPLPRGQPNGDLLLAQALDQCIEAERRKRESSAAIIARQPETARADVRRLMQTVRALEQERSRAMPSVTFRAEARARLMRRIGGASGVAFAEPRTIGAARPFTSSTTSNEARTRWLIRGVAGLVAAAAATAAAVGVSASALPGDALYGFKQAREELSLRLAADDEQRVQALLQRGDARLDETSRLIELGRTTEAAQTVQRFDAVVERATTAMVDTSDVAQPEPVRGESPETKLDEQHERLRRILEVAPQPARDDLREALRVAALDRDLAVEPRPAAEDSEADRDEPPPTALASRPGPSRAIGDSDAGRERPSTPVPARASSAPPRQQQPATLAREHRPAEPAHAGRSGEEPRAERAAESARQERSPEPTREARSAFTAGPAVTVATVAAGDRGGSRRDGEPARSGSQPARTSQATDAPRR